MPDSRGSWHPGSEGGIETSQWIVRRKKQLHLFIIAYCNLLYIARLIRCELLSFEDIRSGDACLLSN